MRVKLHRCKNLHLNLLLWMTFCTARFLKCQLLDVTYSDTQALQRLTEIVCFGWYVIRTKYRTYVTDLTSSIPNFCGASDIYIDWYVNVNKYYLILYVFSTCTSYHCGQKCKTVSTYVHDTSFLDFTIILYRKYMCTCIAAREAKRNLNIY